MSNKYPGGIITSGANAGYSVAFDGTGDYLTTPSSANLSVGAGDFSIEAWVYFTGSPASAMIFTNISSNDTQLAFRIDGSNFPKLQGWNTNFVTSSTTVAQNQWYHLVCCRVSNSTSIFINGTRTANATVTNNFSSTNAFTIGGTASADYLNGYISNLRVVKGSSPYDPTQTTIRVPTQLLNITNTQLLTCNSPAIVDQSSNAFTITANGNASVSTFTPFTGTQLVPNPNTLANTQGVWSISDAAYWMSQNKWPMPPNYPLQSLRFNSADSTYLTRTYGSAGNRKTWTLSLWLKRSTLGAVNNFSGSMNAGGTTGTEFFFTSGDLLTFDEYVSSSLQFNLTTTQVFRDVSAWYNIVFAVDTTQATASNRIKIYVNGTQVTAFGTATYPTQNLDTQFNFTSAMALGRNGSFTSGYFNGYMTDIYFVDGQQLTPSSFGANDPNTGVWSPVPYSGTYGTNGFRLSFQDNTGTTATTLGKDYSGNGNNWTPNNFSVAAGSGNDSLTDGPTNWGIDYGNGGEVRGNYETLNPLSRTTGTLVNGNLQFYGASAWKRCNGTISVSTGKWYWEVNIENAPSTPRSSTSNYNGFGFGLASTYDSSTAGGSVTDAIIYSDNGYVKNFSGANTDTGSAVVNGDVLAVAVDLGANTYTFYKNNVSVATGTIGGTAGQELVPFILSYSNAFGLMSANFGQRPFAYPAPSGFKVLCSTNLPIPTVGATSTTLADDYFNVVTYTGTGSSLSVTGVGFQPDFVWVKGRSGATDHALYDAVRGVQKQLESNTTTAETTETTGLTAFGTDGFTVGSLAQVNTNAATYVGWAWKANGAGVSNTAGSLTSTVSANQTAGISVVTYTIPSASATIETFGHGLGRAPSMVILKVRGNVDEWTVYNANLTTPLSNWLTLNTTAAAGGATSTFSSSSTTFGVRGTRLLGSGTSGNIVAYCFAEIAGFSRFGSYTGNGNADGPFIFTGFRPRFVLIKSSSDGTASNDWVIIDTARNTFNESAKFLRPNLSNAEGDDAGTSPAISIDILSNGFKVRGTSARINTSSSTYIFAVFAEAPFNYSRAR